MASPLYNTALKSRMRDAALRPVLGETSFARSRRGVVFAHDVCAPLPARFERLIGERCACIYSEPAWKPGWVKFHARAGVADYGNYDDYPYRIKALIDHFAKPSFVVCSRAVSELLAPGMTRAIKLYGHADVWLAIANVEMPAAAGNVELVADLAARYRSVYDFSCGYGAALRPFEFFVGSDIDKKCLNYIERELLPYGRDGQQAGDGRDRANPALPQEPTQE